jgi:predicted transcriptional regulator
MALQHNQTVEKVTFNIPKELKAQLVSLKNEMHVSLSAIYNEALSNYIKQKELEKWEKGVSLASKDRHYLKLAETMDDREDEIYAY